MISRPTCSSAPTRTRPGAISSCRDGLATISSRPARAQAPSGLLAATSRLLQASLRGPASLPASGSSRSCRSDSQLGDGIPACSSARLLAEGTVRAHLSERVGSSLAHREEAALLWFQVLRFLRLLDLLELLLQLALAEPVEELPEVILVSAVRGRAAWPSPAPRAAFRRRAISERSQ